MNSTLAVYDIPKALRIPNPSAQLRRYGIRLNLSAWIFPPGRVPVDVLEDLKAAGGSVHLIEFAEKSWEQVLDLARAEVRRVCKDAAKYVQGRVEAIRLSIEIMQDEPAFLDGLYIKWRAVIGKARRELLSAEQCAFGFTIAGDVTDATEALKQLLAAQLDAALAWKASRTGAQKAAVTV